ncbi:MAG: hypothetical protein WC498_01435 [Candidatus Saccharimonadales bacterium]
MTRNSSHSSLQPQSFLVALAGRFVRQRNFGYASLQELPASTHHDGFRFTDGAMR